MVKRKTRGIMSAPCPDCGAGMSVANHSSGERMFRCVVCDLWRGIKPVKTARMPSVTGNPHPTLNRYQSAFRYR